jgi:hypothetical protein
MNSEQNRIAALLSRRGRNSSNVWILSAITAARSRNSISPVSQRLTKRAIHELDRATFRDMVDPQGRRWPAFSIKPSKKYGAGNDT